MYTATEIRDWLTEQIAGILGLAEEEIHPDETFDSFGLASRDAVSLSGDLEDYLGRRLSPTLLYQYPTIQKLAIHLAEPEDKSYAVSGDQRHESVRSEEPRSTETIAAMSEEEAVAALLQKLQNLDE